MGLISSMCVDILNLFIDLRCIICLLYELTPLERYGMISTWTRSQDSSV